MYVSYIAHWIDILTFFIPGPFCIPTQKFRGPRRSQVHPWSDIFLFMGLIRMKIPLYRHFQTFGNSNCVLGINGGWKQKIIGNWILEFESTNCAHSMKRGGGGEHGCQKEAIWCTWASNVMDLIKKSFETFFRKQHTTNACKWLKKYYWKLRFFPCIFHAYFTDKHYYSRHIHTKYVPTYQTYVLQIYRNCTYFMHYDRKR